MDIEAKREFVEGPLEYTLVSAGLGVTALRLSEDGTKVQVIFAGISMLVNIEGDSLGAIIIDVTRKALG